MRESVTEQQNQRQMEREDTDAIITQLAQDLRKAEVTISTTKHEKSETLQWAEAKITALLDERSKWEEQKFQAREFKAKQEILLQQQEAKIRQLEHDLQEKQKSIEAFEGRSKYTKWMEDKLIRLEEDIMIRDDNRTKYKEEQNLMLQQREGKTLMKQAPGGLRETQGLEEQQSKFTEKNSKLRTQNEMAQNELNRLRREVAQLRELNDHQRERLEVLEAQRRSAKDQERAVGTQQTKCAVELARARTQIKQLQQQLGTKDTQIKNLLGQSQISRHEQQSPGSRNSV
ncbi:golgin subfamily A member 6-like protein 22 isoform X2 [Pomacea canaliculata]|uniref:golgin subfamily A member 6-like protein 22 isoform X2 n=1 Tax=Pomacea canaliculata TaxID=400727 RepID=UPI000D73A9FB|nr:golgin subfamily A member 6-like protein 22 isoform X2 [Pomacea canaliculata]